MKQRFPISGLSLQSEELFVARSLWLSYWSCRPGFFFCSHSKKKQIPKREVFRGWRERGNAPNLLTFKGHWTLNCTLWLCKSPVHLPNSTFCTGSSCNYCSRRMWPLIEEKMTRDHDLERRHLWSDLCWNQVSLIMKYSLLVLMAWKILLIVIFFLFLTYWKGFCLHSLWSEKSRSWTLVDKYNFQCVIPMMTYWFQYPLYSLHGLFIFLFFSPSWQLAGTRYCRHISKPMGR